MAGHALAMSMIGGTAFGRSSAMAQEFEEAVDVLNYARTLEHLEYAFYWDGIGQSTLRADPFGISFNSYLVAIRDHEGAHVETLTGLFVNLGGTPVEEATYDFGYDGDPRVFLVTTMALENTGVGAYDGAAKFIENPDLLTAAGTIVAVEARHASSLNLLNDEFPFPAGFETPLTMDDVLAIAGPFFVS